MTSFPPERSRRRVLPWLAVCWIALALPIQARQTGRPLTPDDYLAMLDRTRERIAALDAARWAEVNRIADALPSEWLIAGPDRTYHVSTVWLLVSLNRWRDHPDSTVQAEMLAGLDQRRRDAADLRRPPRDTAAERAALTRILARPEFRGVRGPSWLDQLRARVAAWLLRWLGMIVRSSAVPTITRLAVYGLAALAIVALAIALFKTLRPRPGDVAQIASEVVPVVQTWRQWRADAEAAAERGRWRDAVHAAYWCGIAFLETQGAWRHDATRTPREYLRLLPGAAAPTRPLTSLTHLLETVWYGTQPASAADFDRARVSLEELGCPSR